VKLSRVNFARATKSHRRTSKSLAPVLDFDDEAWAKYDALRNRYDSALTDALEDALEIIRTKPDSAEARQSRYASVADEPPVWIVDAPPTRNPLLRIYWQLEDDGPVIVHIEEP
jgi:hypothetical protein